MRSTTVMKLLNANDIAMSGSDDAAVQKKDAKHLKKGYLKKG